MVEKHIVQDLRLMEISSVERSQKIVTVNLMERGMHTRAQSIIMQESLKSFALKGYLIKNLLGLNVQRAKRYQMVLFWEDLKEQCNIILKELKQ